MTLEEKESKINNLICELSFKEEVSRGGETFTMVKDAQNYFGLFGSPPNRPVAGDSQLAEDLLNHCIAKSKNVRGHLRIPFDFLKFNGYDGQASREFTGLPFVIVYGSKTDQATNKVIAKFKAYEARKLEPVANLGCDFESIFDIFIEYLKEATSIGDSIIWVKTINQSSKT